MALADNAGHEIGVHGAHCAAIDVRDLKEGVGTAPGATFAVDDLTDPPATFMRLHQHCIANTDLQEDRFKRRAAGECRHRPPE